MFIPAIQKTKILVALAVFNYMLFFIASSDYGIITVHSRGYEEKKEAVSIMNDALELLLFYGERQNGCITILSPLSMLSLNRSRL